MTCGDCGTLLVADEGRFVCPADDCRIPPVVKPCELCGAATTSEAPFGFMCSACCFAGNH
jgi:hypothetical protein